MSTSSNSEGSYNNNGANAVIDGGIAEDEGAGATGVLPTRRAFLHHEVHIRAVSGDRIKDAGVDLNGVCSRTIAVMPQLRAMRALIEAKFKDFDFVAYDSIGERVYAVHYCNAIWRSKSKAKTNLSAPVAEVDAWTFKLTKACEFLGALGKLDVEPLKELGQKGGYAGKVNDLTTVLGLLRRADAATLNQHSLTEASLNEVEFTLLTFQGELGKREVGPLEREEAGILREQAFSYLFEAYELARRAAFYLYDEKTADQLVPSLYADRGKAAGKGVAAESDSPDVGPEAAPAAAAKKGTASATPEPFVMVNTAGLPLTNPFVDDEKA